MLVSACGAGAGQRGTEADAGNQPGQSTAVKSAVASLLSPVTWDKPTQLSKPIDLHGKTVWWVPIGDSVASIHAIGLAFTQAVEAAGGRVRMCDGKFSPVDIGQCLTSARNDGAAAVATYFVDYTMAPNAFDSVAAKGVPVLVAGSEADKANTPMLSFVDTSEMTTHIDESVAVAGVAAGGNHPSAIAMMLDDSPTSLAGTKAMAKKFSAMCPGCPLATVDYTSANADKLTSNAAAAMLRNQNANVFLVPNDGMVPAIQQAIKTSGRTSVKIVSALGDLNGLQMVKSGAESGDVGLAVTYMGWFTANELFQQLVGDKLSPTPTNVARYFDSSNVGSLELTPTGYDTGSWYGDDSYRAAFKRAWGLT